MITYANVYQWLGEDGNALKTYTSCNMCNCISMVDRRRELHQVTVVLIIYRKHQMGLNYFIVIQQAPSFRSTCTLERQIGCKLLLS